MESNSGSPEPFKYILTWIFVLLIKRTTLQGKKKITLLDKTIQVYTYNKDSPTFAQATLFGTILWNISKTERLSPQAQQLLLSHELSHKNRNIIWKTVLYGLLLMSLWFLYKILQLALNISLGESFPIVLVDAIWPFIFSFSIFLIAFRVEEVLADYYSLQMLGEQHFIEGYRELLEGPNTFVGRIQRKVLYNNPNQTIRLYNILNP